MNFHSITSNKEGGGERGIAHKPGWMYSYPTKGSYEENTAAVIEALVVNSCKEENPHKWHNLVSIHRRKTSPM